MSIKAPLLSCSLFITKHRGCYVLAVDLLLLALYKTRGIGFKHVCLASIIDVSRRFWYLSISTLSALSYGISTIVALSLHRVLEPIEFALSCHELNAQIKHNEIILSNVTSAYQYL